MSTQLVVGVTGASLAASQALSSQILLRVPSVPKQANFMHCVP